ncbi:hypothetical protein PWYN_25900 [Paenibacillus wynnii]|uniref:Uncharacterized protein n=1 Tax=Paenibacillus wynnii TaxID=268407 RepID=A0A098M5Z0_9BACL|nr:hypothetical protein PWYN_25900 [Paenibacillus wynnii]
MFFNFALFANIEAAENQEEHEYLGRDLTKLWESTELSSEKFEQVSQKLETQLLENPKPNPLRKQCGSFKKTIIKIAEI